MYVFLILPFVAIINYLSNSKKIEKILIFLMIFFSVFRGVGTDYILIKNMFSGFQNLTPYFYDKLIIGLLSNFNIELNFKYQIYIGLTSFLTNILILKSGRKILSEKGFKLFLVLYILSFEYFISYNIFRQYLAISVGLYSLSLFLEFKIKRAIIFIIIGFLIHKSIILIAFIFYLKKKKNPVIIFPVLIFILIIFGELEIVIKILNYIPFYGKRYLEFKEVFLMKRENFRLARIFIEIFIIYIFLMPFILKKENQNNIYINIILITNIMFIMSMYIPIFMRAYTTFNMLSMLGISYLYSQNKKFEKLQILLILYFLIIYFKLLRGNVGEVYPYLFFI